MTRPTPERLEEIKDMYLEHGCLYHPTGDTVGELLAEIDALREESQGWKNGQEQAQYIANCALDDKLGFQKECKRLEEENKKLITELGKHYDVPLCEHLQDQIEALREENADLKLQNDTSEYVKEIRHERDQLKDRVANLRKALDIAAGIVDNNPKDCFIHVRQALAADDEAAK